MLCSFALKIRNRQLRELSVSTLNSNFFFYKTRWVRVFEYAIKGTNCSVVREGIPSSPRVKIFSAWKAINSRVERELQSFSSILTVSSVHKGTSIRSKQSCLFVSYASSNNLWNFFLCIRFINNNNWSFCLSILE